jgi:hypothetical protein
MPWLVSVCSLTVGAAGWVKLGQPDPLSNLVWLSNSNSPQPGAAIFALVLVVDVTAGEGAFGARFAQHLILLGAQFLAPFALGQVHALALFVSHADLSSPRCSESAHNAVRPVGCAA